SISQDPDSDVMRSLLLVRLWRYASRSVGLGRRQASYAIMPATTGMVQPIPTIINTTVHKLPHQRFGWGRRKIGPRCFGGASGAGRITGASAAGCTSQTTGTSLTSTGTTAGISVTTGWIETTGTGPTVPGSGAGVKVWSEAMPFARDRRIK